MHHDDIDTRRSRTTLCMMTAAVLIALASSTGVAQSASASVGVSLKVLPPVSSNALPGMSVGLTRDGTASVRSGQSPENERARVVTTLSAADDRGPLAARFALAGRSEGRGPEELVVDAGALMGFGVLSADTPATAGSTAAGAPVYVIRLRTAPGKITPDTGAVHVILRYVLTVAGS